MPTIDDIRGDKQILKGEIIALLEEFANKHSIFHMDVNVRPIERFAGAPMFDVEIIVNI